MSDRRPKRRCVARKTLVPSAMHYVGYVEEDETPEMIMKKFEALEKVLQASSKLQPTGPTTDTEPTTTEQAAADDPGPSKAAEQEPTDMVLDETQLIEVFKQTSIFNVKSALANNSVLMAGDHNGEHHGDRGNDSDGWLSSDEEEQWNYLKGFWTEADSEFFTDKPNKRGPKRRGAAKDRLKAVSTKRSERCQQLITAYNKDTNSLIRRKVKVYDPDAILQIRVPAPPLPLSWARSVKPFVPKHAKHAKQAAAAALAMVSEPANRSSCHEAADITAFDFKSLPVSAYQAILINTGWEVKDPTAAAGPSSSSASSSDGLERLRQLPLPALCPKGFIFVWADKQYIHPVVKQLQRWGYGYVENLTWVMMAPNNSILQFGDKYANKSHVTLLIFRKEGEGRDIELRHQRSPDVVFECIAAAPGRQWAVPPQVYSTIETMLPTGKGIFLELWAAQGSARPGWTHVAQAS